MATDITEALRELVRSVVSEELAREREARSSGTELLTTSEASALAKVKPATIRTWIRTGQLRATTVGRSIRIARAELDAVLSGSIRARNKPLNSVELARRDHLILVGKR